MTADSGTHTGREGTNPPVSPRTPELVLCAVDEPLATAWTTVAEKLCSTGAPPRAGGSATRTPEGVPTGRVRVHRGSVLDVVAQAVVSPANSYGWMRGGIDAVYARAFPGVEQSVRSAVLAFHGGELPIGEAVVVPTGEAEPAWLISAPTMREPGELLPADTVHPYLAARAVFLLWRDGKLDQGPVREAVDTIAMPGLGTGVGGVDPATCARQVAAAWDEVFRHAR
ncbi:macro domain-containing protein [Amycolatopsis australiensis]|uniref:O-acetyl-ADP-ribose deacetylase (Regulator of RNase III), contains Macro domain n=1 Tax=Amycolatopsis australiensis TaxID=546364 RepID=A0A1K1PUR9_9PSEU|nr:macro domain-containing protein [Amycolatopsis australiensis]SFW51408.1 O-acetyl-ADP-ribose deacetylase (regulator of RNase III), contains Macro domain [Amycolatopsis australiensis]